MNQEKEKRKVEVLKQVSSSIFSIIKDEDFDRFEKIAMLNSVYEILQEEGIRMRRELDKSVLKPMIDQIREEGGR